MLQPAYILLIILAPWLMACNSSGRHQKTEAENTPAANLVKKEDREAEGGNVQDLRNECIRGQAEPVIKRSVFPKTRFMLQADSLTAVETVDFENGDKLIIRNWGCEYYVLSFRFETSRFKADTSALKYWYVSAYKILKELKKGIGAPVDVEKGLEALNSYVSKNAFNLKLQAEIDFGGDDIREFITLEQIEKLAEDRYALTVSFTTGPL